jgi:hypothetical protein
MTLRQMIMRQMIVDRTRIGGVGSWPLNTYSHLINCGVTSEDAIQAMNAFLDEVIALRPHALERSPERPH